MNSITRGHSLSFTILMCLLCPSCKDDPIQPTGSSFPPVIGFNAPQMIGGPYGGAERRHYIFGQVATSNNLVYAVNRSVRGVSVFDDAGNHLRDVAPQGLGTLNNRLAVRGNSIVLADGQHIQLFTDDEETTSFRHWKVEGNVRDVARVVLKILVLVENGGNAEFHVYSYSGEFQEVRYLTGPRLLAGQGGRNGDLAVGYNGRVMLMAQNGVWWYDKALNSLGKLDISDVVAIDGTMDRVNYGEDETVIALGSDDVVRHLNETGTELRRWAGNSVTRGYMFNVNSIAHTLSGTVVTSDGSYNRLTFYDGNTREPTFVEGNNYKPGSFSVIGGIGISESGEVYVTDRVNHTVQVFSRQGNHRLTFGYGGTRNGNLTSPRDIVFSSSGDVFIADASGIHRFSRDGEFLGSWNVGGKSSLLSIAIDSEDRIYALLNRYPDYGKVLVYDVTGEELSASISFDSFPLEDMAIDRRTNLVYVVASGSVTVYEPLGDPPSGMRLVHEWSTGRDLGRVSTTIDAQGNVYLADAFAYKAVRVFDATGNRIAEWDNPFSYPQAIAIAADGSVWLGDYSFVYHFAPVPLEAAPQ